MEAKLFVKATGTVPVGHRAELVCRFISSICSRIYSCRACKGTAINFSSCDPVSLLGLLPSSRLEIPQLLCSNEGRYG